MNKKEKDSSYWICVLLTGVAFGAVTGFTFGWLWKEGPTSSEATKLVDVLIAAGTIGAALGAVYSSRSAMVIAKNQREDARAHKRQEAISYMLSRLEAIECSIDFLGDMQDRGEGRGEAKTSEQLRSDADRAVALLSSIDLDKAREVDFSFRRDIAAVAQKLARIQSKNRGFDDGFHTHYPVELIDGLRRKMVNIKLALYDEA